MLQLNDIDIEKINIKKVKRKELRSALQVLIKSGLTKRFLCSSHGNKELLEIFCNNVESLNLANKDIPKPVIQYYEKISKLQGSSEEDKPDNEKKSKPTGERVLIRTEPDSPSIEIIKGKIKPKRKVKREIKSLSDKPKDQETEDFNEIHVMLERAGYTKNYHLLRYIVDGLDEALLLWHLISEYNLFKKRKRTSDGWFYNTADRREEYTGIKKYRQKQAIENLIKMKILQTKIKDVPAKTYFKISFLKLKNLMSDFSKLASENDENE